MKTVLYNEEMLEAVVEDMRNLMKDGKHINIEYEVKKKEKTKAQVGFWFGCLVSGIYDFLLERGESVEKKSVEYALYEQIAEYVPELMVDMSIFRLKDRARHLGEIRDRELMAKLIDGAFELIEQDPMYKDLMLHPSISHNWAFHVNEEDIKYVEGLDLPERDKWYLEYVRTRPCLCCGRMNCSEAHHVKIKELVAMGKKTPDWTAVPLCHNCHMNVAHGGGFREAMKWLPINMLDFCKLSYVRWKNNMGR